MAIKIPTSKILREYFSRVLLCLAGAMIAYLLIGYYDHRSISFEMIPSANTLLVTLLAALLLFLPRAIRQYREGRS